MKIRSRAPILLGASVLLAACGAGDVPDFDFKEGKKPPSEARDVARQEISEAFTEYGGSYYTLYATCTTDSSQFFAEFMQAAKSGSDAYFDLLENGGHKSGRPPVLVSLDLFEFKKVQTDVYGEDLTDADKLNGVRWKGKFQTCPAVSRSRQLDLMPAFRELASGSTETLISWSARPLVFRAPDGFAEDVATAVAASEKNGDEDKVDEDKVDDIFSGMMDRLVNVPALEALEGTGWTEWQQEDDTNYQSIYIVAKKNGVTTYNERDADIIIPDGKTVALHDFSHSGGFLGGLMAAAAQDGNSVFLLRPDMKALKKAGLLK